MRAPGRDGPYSGKGRPLALLSHTSETPIDQDAGSDMKPIRTSPALAAAAITLATTS